MVTLEQKIDLIMQYIVADSAKEKNQLKNEIVAALSDTAVIPESSIDNSSTNDDLMHDIIDGLLTEIGAPCHILGYDRAAYAIKLSISDPEYLNYITYRLYPDVAKEFGTTRTRVERAIRHLIEVVWTKHDLEAASRIFGNTIDINKGKPTNSEFIACCAREVKRRMRDAQ